MVKAAKNLPAPCPRCGGQKGYVEVRETQRTYHVKTDNFSPGEYEFLDTEDGRRAHRRGHTYRYVRIYHPGNNKSCKLEAEEAEYFIGLKYRDPMHKAEEVSKKLLRYCELQVAIGEKVKSDPAKLADQFGEQIVASWRMEFTSVGTELNTARQVIEHFINELKLRTISSVYEDEDLDEWLARANILVEYTESLADLILHGPNKQTEARVRELWPRYESTCLEIEKASEGANSADADLDEMLDWFQRNENDLDPQIDAVKQILNGDHDALERHLPKLRVDLTRLDENEEAQREFEDLFNSNPHEIPYFRLLFMSPSLLKAMRLMIRFHPGRFGQPPASIEDLSRLPPKWACWYFTLSIFSVKLKELRDGRVKVPCASQSQVVADAETINLRGVGKRYGVSAKQVKRYIHKNKQKQTLE